MMNFPGLGDVLPDFEDNFPGSEAEDENLPNLLFFFFYFFSYCAA